MDSYRHLVRRHVDLPRSRVLEIPIGRDATLAPLARTWVAPRTANIMTLLMLPLAHALAGTILILGADGRDAEDVGFWKRLEPARLEALLPTVEQCHPAFFAKRNYRRYYQEHCAVVERQIRSIEAAGGTVQTLAPSSIPALASRAATNSRAY